jgi:hypothetical protein
VGWFVAVEVGLEDAEESEVVALSSAGGEDDLFRRAVQHRCDGGACVLDGRACALAGVVCGAGVAEAGGEVGQHGLDDLGQYRGGGVGVEVDALHRLILSWQGVRCCSVVARG